MVLVNGGYHEGLNSRMIGVFEGVFTLEVDFWKNLVSIPYQD